MVLRGRSEIIQPGDSVGLKAQFKDSSGNLADLDAFPTITIFQPSGAILLGPTSQGVFKVSTGLYEFDYSVGLNPAHGIWADQWNGVLNGQAVTGTFNFAVLMSQVPIVNTDGYEMIGDDPGFNYSQTAIRNINKLLKSLKARLNSAGKRKGLDSFGNVTYEDCDIFTVDSLVTFLSMSLTDFNLTAHFTSFGFDDTEIIDQFHDLFVQGATVYSLASKALIERGREFSITDAGVNFTPPTVSELLNSQYGTELSNWWDRLKYVKINFKPFPNSLGTFTINNGAHPAIKRLSRLRSRRLI